LQGIKGFEKEAFEKVHTSGEQVTSIRLNPLKLSIAYRSLSGCHLPIEQEVPWSDFGYYLNKRPSFTLDPLFHAGCYYVQEASSMFLEQALKQSLDLSRHLRILDLSAAPGGKSTHIQSLISKRSLLVSNDVIRSRARILQDNIVKWGGDNVVVTSNDPANFGRLGNYFDAVVVDAPCSGSGLFRRDEEAIDHWSVNNVRLCSQRQQRILADVWPALKKNGILIYATCSYSREEDEDVVKWITSEYAAEVVKLKIEESWGIVESSGGYRFWPDKIKGEGFFMSCLKKTEGDDEINIRSKKRIDRLSKREKEIVKPWVKETTSGLLNIGNMIYALPPDLLDDVNILVNTLHLTYAGIRVGEFVREKLLPDHALAMSNFVSNDIERIELAYDGAIAYLRRAELKDIAVKNKGWVLVCYQGHDLGWINVLPNRINNYYPKELRILKDFNQAERE